MAKNKQGDLYYMLPGMARMARQRAIRNLKIGIVAGLLVSGLVSGVLYYFAKFH